MMKEALYYNKLPGNKVECILCPRHCHISVGSCGFCREYKNIDSSLFSLSYGKAASIAVDPIEKKPLYHYYPGEQILSIGSFGCNLACSFCQNHELSFGNGPTQTITSEKILETMIRNEIFHLAFTYNEPVINYEFVLETFQLLKKHQLSTVLVTNGYIEREPLLGLLSWTDAMNIDLKGSDRFYKTICHGESEPVKRTIMHSFEKCHIEITYLVIPDLNDSMDDFSDSRDFLCSISPNIPIHLNRYYPSYHLNKPPTPLSVLIKAREFYMENMPFVYIGNVDLEEAQNTYCHHCHSILIKRLNYDIYYTNIRNGKCSVCGEDAKIYGRDSV